MRTLSGLTKMLGAFLSNLLGNWAKPEAHDAPSKSLSHSRFTLKDKSLLQRLFCPFQLEIMLSKASYVRAAGMTFMRWTMDSVTYLHPDLLGSAVAGTTSSGAID